MRGLPFSLVWTHRQAATHGRTVDVSLDSMATGWMTAVVVLEKGREGKSLRSTRQNHSEFGHAYSGGSVTGHCDVAREGTFEAL